MPGLLFQVAAPLIRVCRVGVGGGLAIAVPPLSIQLPLLAPRAHHAAVGAHPALLSPLGSRVLLPSRRMTNPCQAKTGGNRRAIDAAWYLRSRGIVIDSRRRATCLVDPESLRRRPTCDAAASCALANPHRPHLACGAATWDICISMNRALAIHHARWLI